MSNIEILRASKQECRAKLRLEIRVIRSGFEEKKVASDSLTLIIIKGLLVRIKRRQFWTCRVTLLETQILGLGGRRVGSLPSVLSRIVMSIADFKSTKSKSCRLYSNSSFQSHPELRDEQ